MRRGRAARAALLAALALAGCKGDPAPASAEATAELPGATPEEAAQLLAGEVLVTAEAPASGAGVTVTARGLVEAPADRVFEVVKDCGRFADFMPRTLSSQRTEEPAGSILCEVKIDLPFPMDDLTAITRSKIETGSDGTLTRRWALAGGDYLENKGHWSVRPLKTGQRALLEYHLEVQPKSSVPDAVARQAQKSALPEVFEAIRRRARRG